MSNFTKYYFKTSTIFLPFLSSLVFTALEFDSNHFSFLVSKIVKPHDNNEVKSPIGKIFQRYKPIIYYFVMSQK